MPDNAPNPPEDRPATLQDLTTALAAAEQRARELGFATLSDYLVERRGRGWGQKRTALELGVGFKMVRAALLLCGLEPIPVVRPSMPRSRRTG